MGIPTQSNPRRPAPPPTWVALGVSLLALGGCGLPAQTRREMFAEQREAHAVVEQPRLSAFPVDADPDDAYAAARPIEGEGIADVTSLYAELGDPNARALVFPPDEPATGVAVSYLGQAAFAYRSRVVHHLRLRVINGLEHALLLPLETLRCQGISGSPLLLLAAVNGRRERVEESWGVAPGESRVLHLFLQSRSLDRELSVAWELRAPAPPDGSPPLEGPWPQQVTLERHWVLQQHPISDLERAVVEGETMPPARPPPSSWAEPLLTPVPPSEPVEPGAD